MYIQVRVCTILHLVKVLGGREIEVRLPQGATVADLLRVLANRADVDPPDALFSDSSGCLKTEILVMVNGRQLSFLQGTDTILSADDEVLLLPAVAGG